MTYHYHIWLNMGRFEPLKHAYTGTIDAELESTALERLFEIFNGSHPSNYNNRSLSVGDVVSLNGRVWACGLSSWQHLSFVPEGTVQP
jgi:hypothetical protein